MLTKRYMSTNVNVPKIFAKIVTGTAPTTFNREHLSAIGFAGSNDRAIIPIMKDLGFLGPDGAPTQRYHEYRNSAKSKEVMADALREMYGPIFHLNAKPGKEDRNAIIGLFKSQHNITDQLAGFMANTFFALADLADFSKSGTSKTSDTDGEPKKKVEDAGPLAPEVKAPRSMPGLHYTIEIHLPATKDIEVYKAIFKSLKEYLVD